jgi:hypothetical protein
MKNFIQMQNSQMKSKADEGEVLQFGRVLLEVILQTVYECCNRGLLRKKWVENIESPLQQVGRR